MSSTTQTLGESPPVVNYPNLLSWEESLAGFTAMCTTFEAARLAHANEYAESFYTLAGKSVHLRVVGRALMESYQRALAPRLSQAIAVPDLTIDLWDEDATGIPCPAAAFPFDVEASKKETQRYLGDSQLQFGDASGRWVCAAKAGTATWLDRKANHLIGWRAQGGRLPTHERSKPLSIVLPIWFYDQGIHILHAGMVARNGAGVLITGGSGIGKTTTTLACLLAGMDYLSDDQVGVTRPTSPVAKLGGKFVAHSIFQSARVFPDHLQCFPELHARAMFSHDPLDPKALLLLSEWFPQRVVANATINAIALPRLAGQAETSTQRASRTEALNYMARTSLFMPMGVGRARFETLTQLLGSVPCYWLNLGHDLARIPQPVEQLLAAHTA